MGKPIFARVIIAFVSMLKNDVLIISNSNIPSHVQDVEHPCMNTACEPLYCRRTLNHEGALKTEIHSAR